MKTFTEGNIQITFSKFVKAEKFDDKNHGLSHCLKAVDFIVELIDKILFVEIKDYQHPDSSQANRDNDIANFSSGKIDSDLAQKYRDTFLYEWACENLKKPIYYYVLIGIDSMTEADLLTRSDALKRFLPQNGPKSGVWKKTIVKDCMVFNIATWNKHLSEYECLRIV